MAAMPKGATSPGSMVTKGNGSQVLPAPLAVHRMRLMAHASTGGGQVVQWTRGSTCAGGRALLASTSSPEQLPGASMQPILLRKPCLLMLVLPFM